MLHHNIGGICEFLCREEFAFCGNNFLPLGFDHTRQLAPAAHAHERVAFRRQGLTGDSCYEIRIVQHDDER